MIASVLVITTEPFMMYVCIFSSIIFAHSQSQKCHSASYIQESVEMTSKIVKPSATLKAMSREAVGHVAN